MSTDYTSRDLRYGDTEHVNALAEEFDARPGAAAGGEWITRWHAWQGKE